MVSIRTSEEALTSHYKAVSKALSKLRKTQISPVVFTVLKLKLLHELKK